MSYIPVGTILTYTASLNTSLFSGFNGQGTLASIISQLGTDLKNLPGLEEFDIQTSHGNPSFVGLSTISLTILNNGVDHASETDCQSIFDGCLQNDGVSVVSSSITQIQLPNNPPQSTGAAANLTVLPTATPTTGGSAFSLSNLFPSLSGGTIAGISITVIVIAIIALILLMPNNARRLVTG